MLTNYGPLSLILSEAQAAGWFALLACAILADELSSCFLSNCFPIGNVIEGLDFRKGL
jgi:hypothetical protein